MPRQSKPEKKTTAKTNTESGGITKKSHTKPTQKKRQEKEESSDSEFSFEEGSVEDSTELSSSGTDEFTDGKAHIALELDTKTKDELKTKVDKNKKSVLDIEHSDPRGVIYLGRIPYGLCEPEMRKFFSQFGEVTRLRLSRSKKTGHSKHYAFIEFLDPIVADIVAETMDGYIMFTKMLRCKVIPPEKVHPKLFKGDGERLRLRDNRKINRTKMEKGTTNPERKARKILRQESKKRETLKKLGIDYDFPTSKVEVVGKN